MGVGVAVRAAVGSWPRGFAGATTRAGQVLLVVVVARWKVEVLRLGTALRVLVAVVVVVAVAVALWHHPYPCRVGCLRAAAAEAAVGR